MIYEYQCQVCGEKFEVVKSVSEIDRSEPCRHCASMETSRMISRTHFYGANDWDKAYYSHAFGKVVKNKRHRKELARQHNVEEVGNDFVNGDNMQKHYDDEREKRLEARWDEV